MDMLNNPELLIWGMLFGTIGFGFFTYGRKQKAIIPLISGLSLMAYPYFVSNVYVLIAIGIGLIALPYFVRA